MDLTKVPPIQQKRIVEFVNNFVIGTVEFLDKFSNNCEIGLQRLDVKLRKVEAELCILESKLNSVPALIAIPVSIPSVPQSTVVPSTVSSPEPKTVDPVSTEPSAPATQVDETQVTVSPAQEDIIPDETDSKPKEVPEELKRFFKMIQFGVPIPAVKLKMKAEGFDPSLIDS